MKKTYQATKPIKRTTMNPVSNVNTQEVTTADSPYYDKYQLKPYNPATLYQRKTYDVYDDMREDDQIGPMLTLKKQIVLNSDWIIDCEDEEVNDFLNSCLRDFIDDSFTRKLFDILTAIDYGFSITEKIFAVEDTLEYGQKIVLKKLKTRAPHSFEIHTDAQGNIFLLIQHTGKGDKPIDTKKVMIYSYRKEFDNPYGNADLNKGVYRAWWAKDAIIKFWNIYLERFASPLTIGTISRSAGEGDKNAFKNVMNDISAKTSITVPDGFAVDFLHGSGSAGEFEAAIDKYNMMISRALLIPDLLGFSGSKTSGGSLALGKEQFDIFYTTIEYIRNDLQLLVNREIIKPLIAMNYGNNIDAKFKFERVDHEKKQADFQLWLQAVNTGQIPVLDKHVNWVLENVDAPLIEDEEFAEIEAKKAEIQEQMQPKPIGEKDAKEKPIPKEESKPKEKPNDEEIEAEEERSNTLKQYAFSRKETANEKKANVKEIDKTLTADEEKWSGILGKQFEVAINGVLDDVKRNKVVEKKKINKVNDLKIRNIRQINRTFENMLKDIYSYGKSTVPIKKFDLEGAEEVASWFAEYAFYVSDTEGAYILKTIKPIILDGIRTGKSFNEISKMAKQSLDSYNMAVDGNRVKTAVNTTISKSFNEARKQAFEEIGDEIIAYEYSAIMDQRTSKICIALDGKIFRPEELDKFNPPNHFKCRSLVIPIFKDEVTEDFKFDTIPATESKSGDFLELK